MFAVSVLDFFHPLLFVSYDSYKKLLASKAWNCFLHGLPKVPETHLTYYYLARPPKAPHPWRTLYMNMIDSIAKGSKKDKHSSCYIPERSAFNVCSYANQVGFQATRTDRMDSSWYLISYASILYTEPSKFGSGDCPGHFSTSTILAYVYLVPPLFLLHFSMGGCGLLMERIALSSMRLSRAVAFSVRHGRVQGISLRVRHISGYAGMGVGNLRFMMFSERYMW